MSFKYENGKVVEVRLPHIIGNDAKKILNSSVPKQFIEKILKKKFITIPAL